MRPDPRCWWGRSAVCTRNIPPCLHACIDHAHACTPMACLEAMSCLISEWCMLCAMLGWVTEQIRSILALCITLCPSCFHLFRALFALVDMVASSCTRTDGCRCMRRQIHSQGQSQPPGQAGLIGCGNGWISVKQYRRHQAYLQVQSESVQNKVTEKENQDTSELQATRLKHGGKSPSKHLKSIKIKTPCIYDIPTALLDWPRS